MLNLTFYCILQLYLVSLLYGFNNPKCKGIQYKCGLNNKPNVCLNISDNSKRQYDLTECSRGMECLVKNANDSNPIINCTLETPNKNQWEGKRLPGEKCGSDLDCLDNSKCQQGICSGFEKNENCSHTNQCNAGLYCKISYDKYNKTQYKCQELEKFGSNCSKTSDCENNCVCNLKECAYFYSMDIGLDADNQGNINYQACQSGYIYNGKCSYGKPSQIKARTCQNDKDCIILNETGQPDGYTECQCGYNDGSFSYCKLSEGDPEFQEMINKFQYILQSSSRCHSNLRYGPCKFLYEDEYRDYINAKLFYENFPQLKFNDKCIKNIYTSFYWDISSQISRYYQVYQQILQNINFLIFIYVILFLFFQI